MNWTTTTTGYTATTPHASYEITRQGGYFKLTIDGRRCSKRQSLAACQASAAADDEVAEALAEWLLSPPIPLSIQSHQQPRRPPFPRRLARYRRQWRKRSSVSTTVTPLPLPRLPSSVSLSAW